MILILILIPRLDLNLSPTWISDPINFCQKSDGSRDRRCQQVFDFA